MPRMTAEEALGSLIAALPDYFEDQGEIGVLSRAAEAQDKMDLVKELCEGAPKLPEDDDDEIWGPGGRF